MNTPKQDTFENYLQEIHAKQYVGLDDDMGEDFADWLADLDVETILDYGRLYGMSRFNAGMKEVIDQI